MGFLSKYAQTERVDLGDSYWVDVIPFLTTAQRGAADKVLVAPRFKSGKDGDVDMDMPMDMAAFRLELATQAVQVWNLTDEADQVLPFDSKDTCRDSLRRVPVFVVDEIVKVVEGANVRTPSEAATFPPESDESAEG